jgi:CubicO group peptidase (beta-lactamase class C family)
MIRIVLIFSAMLLFLSSCQQPKATESKLDKLFDSLFKKDEPGGAVLITKDGKTIYSKGFGIADIKTKEAITPTTLFNVGSISKTFVAFGILKLAAENKLSLEDELYKYFPNFKDSTIPHKVKLKHMLTHTSGLPNLRKINEDSVFYLTAKDEGNWEPVYQADSLEFEPGSRYTYSNIAFNGLALIIEKVTGMKWQDYIRKNIMEPAGMKLSTIQDGAYPESGISHGYVYDGKNYFEKDYGEEPTFPASGNGGVWSSVEELWKYEKAIQESVFLDSNWIKRSRTVFEHTNWNGAEPSELGLSWFMTNFENNKLIGHTGSQGGFRADYVWVPAKNVFYVILCNTPKDLYEVRKSVFKILEL